MKKFKKHPDKELAATKSLTDWDKIDSMKDEEIDFSDSPELTEEDFARSKPAMEIPAVAAAVRKGRGPQKRPKKVPKSLRLSPEVLEFFEKEGRGWQKKIDDVLKEYVKKHRKAA